MDKSRHQIAADLPTKPTSLLSKWDFEFKYQQSLIKCVNFIINVNENNRSVDLIIIHSA